VLFVPVMLAITLVQWLLLVAVDVLGTVSGEGAGAWAFVSVVVATTFALFGLGLVQAAAACALVEIDANRRVAASDAYRLALRRFRPLVVAIALFVLAWVVLTSTVVLIPIALWLAVRWCLAAPVVELEEQRPFAALRRSGELVRGKWLRVGSLVGVSAALGFLIGPLIGALLIFTSTAPFWLLNLVAGVVYALAMPFVALVTSYVYFDARARAELEPVERVSELPAEIQLTTTG
jgi:hypothetical protein